MTRGQLPKAYLRIDPNIDQTHPDNLEGFVRLLCAANRQPTRGAFKTRAVLDALLGRTAVTRLLARGDVVVLGDARVEVPGWETWQEGDLTVGERVRRYRDQHAAGRDNVTPASRPSNEPSVTQPLPSRIPASEASRRQGSKAVGVGSSFEETLRTPRERSRPDVAALLARGWKQVTTAQLAMLEELADRHDRPSKGEPYGTWAAAIIAETSADERPFDVLARADRLWQERRRQEIDDDEARAAAEKAAERAAPTPTWFDEALPSLAAMVRGPGVDEAARTRHRDSAIKTLRAGGIDAQLEAKLRADYGITDADLAGQP